MFTHSPLHCWLFEICVSNTASSPVFIITVRSWEREEGRGVVPSQERRTWSCCDPSLRWNCDLEDEGGSAGSVQASFRGVTHKSHLRKEQAHESLPFFLLCSCFWNHSVEQFAQDAVYFSPKSLTSIFFFWRKMLVLWRKVNHCQYSVLSLFLCSFL